MAAPKPDPKATYYGYCCTTCGFERIDCMTGEALMRAVMNICHCRCFDTTKQTRELVVVENKRDDIPSILEPLDPDYFCWR